MCGVVAYRPTRDVEFIPPVPYNEICKRFEALMRESMVRGRHAFGIYQDGQNHRSFDVDDVIKKFNPESTAIAHCRYSTSGDWRDLNNAQPVVHDGVALVFNGVIHMGTREEFNREFGVSCITDNDGEIFLQLLDQGVTPEDFITRISGSFAGAWIQPNGTLRFGRNNRRPLWSSYDLGAFWLASTKDILLRAGFQRSQEVPVTEKTYVPRYIKERDA